MKVFNQLEKAQAENVTSDTASEPKGMLKYRTDLNVMKVSDGTTYKEIVDTTTAQTLTTKTLTAPTLTTPLVNAAADVQQIATPSNPAAGRNKLYFKTDGTLYKLSSAGVETSVESVAAAPEINIEEVTQPHTSVLVDVATSRNGTLSTDFVDSTRINGYLLSTNDTILIKDQTTASENGVYIVQASGAPIRHPDYDTFTKLNGASVGVQYGANNGLIFSQTATLTSLSDSQTWGTEDAVNIVAVRVATTANGTFATAFDNASTVDGVSLETGDVILIKNQTTQTENGIFIVNASGSPTRHERFTTFGTLNGAKVFVKAGTSRALFLTQTTTLTSLSDTQVWSAFTSAQPLVVIAATTASGTFASAFDNASTVDGVVLQTGDYILVKNQATASENGVWTVPASGSPTVRHPSFDTVAEASNKAVIVGGHNSPSSTASKASITTRNTGKLFYQSNTLSSFSDTQNWVAQIERTTFTVPAGVNVIYGEIMGGGGGGAADSVGTTGGAGGNGHFNTITFGPIAVTPGEVFNIAVGRGGYGETPNDTTNILQDGGTTTLTRVNDSSFKITSGGGSGTNSTTSTAQSNSFTRYYTRGGNGGAATGEDSQYAIAGAFTNSALNGGSGGGGFGAGGFGATSTGTVINGGNGGLGAGGGGSYSVSGAEGGAGGSGFVRFYYVN